MDTFCAGTTYKRNFFFFFHLGHVRASSEGVLSTPFNAAFVATIGLSVVGILFI